MNTPDDLIFNYYDYGRGWYDTNKGWHQLTIHDTISVKHLEMIKWIYQNLDNPKRHARWIRIEHGSSFKFRYERDYILFTLRWS